MKVEMREITREDAQVIHKLNLGIPVLCEAFGKRDEKKYYALGLEDNGRHTRDRSGGTVKRNAELRLTTKKVNMRPNEQRAIAMGHIRTLFRNNLKAVIPRADIISYLCEKMEISPNRATAAVSVLHKKLGLLEVAE